MSDTSIAPPSPAAAAAAAAAAQSQAAATDAAAAATPAGDSNAAATAAGAADAANAAGAQTDTSTWPAEAVAAYEKARADAAKYQREAGDSRMNAKRGAAADATKAAVKAINDALGIETPDDSALTVEQATEAVSKTKGELAASERDKAVIVEAWAQGVDPTKLGYLQYQLSQNKDLAQLDPTAADFADKIKATVAGLLVADATLKLTGSAVASGVESLGGAGGATEITPEGFAAMSIGERNHLYKTDKAAYDKLVGRAS